MRMHMRGAAILVIVILASATVVRGNSGTQLPLNQYQAGTESTTLVPNGNFEAVTGTDATGWSEVTGMSTASHVSGTNTNASVFGGFAAQGFSTDNSKYTQTLSINPATSYVVSAYIWNFGNAGPAPHSPADFDPGDQAVVELVGSGDVKKTLLLEPIATDGGNGAGGYFVYDTVPAGYFGTDTSITIDVRNDLDTAGPWTGVVTQYDNVAFTPSSQFVAPGLVPEPAGLSLLAVSALSLFHRRRH